MVHSLQRQVTVDLLSSVDCYTVRTPPGQKDPGHYGWDPKNMTLEKSRQNLHRVRDSEDNVGIHLFNNIVDVDVDTDDPITLAALDVFLPHSAHIWGRKSRPKTHRLYQLTADKVFRPGNYRFLSVIKDINELSVEVRGGEINSGQYSLMPGSKHPSGEEYEWTDLKAAQSTPVIIPEGRLMRGVKMALTASLIARYWTEGQRHHVCQALSGFLHRVHVHSQEGEPEDFFEEEDAVALIEGIMTIADDDSADHYARMSTLKKTWAKAAEGTPVTGATRLKELSGRDDIIRLLYALLVNSPELQKFDDFLEQYVLIRNTSEVVHIGSMGMSEVNWHMTHQEFVNGNTDRRIRFGDGSPQEMTRMLIHSEQAQRVDGLTFYPGKDQIFQDKTHTFLNLWRGFRVEPADSATDHDVHLFTHYVKNIIACRNEDCYKWVIAWMADIFQNPGRKPGTALALVGAQGAGKSVLGDAFLRPIIGHHNSWVTNRVESLTGQFNEDSAGKLLIQFDEATNNRKTSAANQLKALITDHTRRIEGKGTNGVQMRDSSRLIFTSNSVVNAVAIDPDDRRYTIIHVNDKYSYKSDKTTVEQKMAYWDKVHTWASDEANLSKLLRWFLDYKYEEKLIRVPFDTEVKRMTQMQSASGISEWLLAIVNWDTPYQHEKDLGGEDSKRLVAGKWVSAPGLWPEATTTTRLLKSYTTFNKGRTNQNHKVDYNEQQFRLELARCGLATPDEKPIRTSVVVEDPRTGRTKRIRRNFYPLFTKRQLRDFIRTSYGINPLEEKDAEIDVDGEDEWEDTPY